MYVLLLALALLLGYDNWRSGMGWAKDGPQSGYLPFYLCVILAGASLCGLGRRVRAARRVHADIRHARPAAARDCRSSFRRSSSACAMQWLGLYVASFLLVAGFMRFIGRIAWWKSLLTSFLFAFAMFATFDMAFDVIMPKGPIEALFGR